MIDRFHQPMPLASWHEDIGDVLWWRSPITEAPYVGSPLDLGATWSLEVFDGVGRTVGERENHRFEVGGWPFSEEDEPHLWWTPLPDARRIQEGIPQ